VGVSRKGCGEVTGGSYPENRTHLVIREATRPEDLRSYLNAAVLRETWRQLFLPVRVRRIWEERFPALRLSA
jgi:hypothetical protein